MHIELKFFSDEDDRVPLTFSLGSANDWDILVNNISNAYSMALEELKRRNLSY